MAGRCTNPKCGSKSIYSFKESRLILIKGQPRVVTFLLYKCNMCGTVFRWSDTVRGYLK